MTKAAHMPHNLAQRCPKVDLCKAKVALYRNEKKSWPWLERAVRWKRQEVSGMLITIWNAAFQALPVHANPIIWIANLMQLSLLCPPSQVGRRWGIIGDLKRAII